MIRKRVIFAVFLGMLATLSGMLLSAAGLIYYAGFVDGGKACNTSALVR